MISRLVLLAASVSAIGLALPLYQHLVFIEAPIYFWIVGALLYLAKGVFVMTQVGTVHIVWELVAKYDVLTKNKPVLIIRFLEGKDGLMPEVVDTILNMLLVIIWVLCGWNIFLGNIVKKIQLLSGGLYVF